MSSRPRVFIARLESLRGLAALAVVLFHVAQVGAGLDPNLSGILGWPTAIAVFGLQTIFNGGAAVILFFVLSGFVMGINVDTDGPLSAKTYARFLVRRFFRLVPLTVAAVLLALLWEYLFLAKTYEPARVLQFLTLQDVSIDGPLWSLRVEILVSLIYPALLFAFAKVPPRARLLLLVLALVWPMARFGPGIIAPFLLSFSLGILIPTLGRDLISRLGSRGSSIALPFAFLLYATNTLTVTFGIATFGQYTVAASFGAFFIVAYVTYGPAIRLLEHRLLRWLGAISFSLYVVHHPIITLVDHFITLPAADYCLIRQAIVFAIAVPLALVVAQVCYVAIERPFMSLASWLTRPRSSPALVPTASASSV